MNFGHCATPDCDYKSEPDSSLCLLCNYVLEREKEINDLNQHITRVREGSLAALRIMQYTQGRAA